MQNKSRSKSSWLGQGESSLLRTLKTSTELLTGAICHSQSQSAGPLGQLIYQADTKFSHWLSKQTLPIALLPTLKFCSHLPATSFSLHEMLGGREQTIHFENKEIEVQRGDRFYNSDGHETTPSKDGLGSFLLAP